jgi:hypothetical protein
MIICSVCKSEWTSLRNPCRGFCRPARKTWPRSFGARSSAATRLPSGFSLFISPVLLLLHVCTSDTHIRIAYDVVGAMKGDGVEASQTAGAGRGARAPQLGVALKRNPWEAGLSPGQTRERDLGDVLFPLCGGPRAAAGFRFFPTPTGVLACWPNGSLMRRCEGAWERCSNPVKEFPAP